MWRKTKPTRMLLADGFDDAILGIGTQFNKTFVIYDAMKCIEILSKDMSTEEAEEYFSFNVIGCYAGEIAPIFLETMNKNDIEERIANA